MPYKVLIVDDEEPFQILLDATLRRNGYQPYTASNTAQAVAAIHKTRPDAMILDDMLPGLSGSEFCAQMKQDPTLQSIRVIMYTSGVRYTLDELRQRSGAEAALRKTGRLQELLGALQQVLAASA